MFSSSRRVKLNRVALKDVVGLKLTPRRRRPPKPASISADSSNNVENVVSELVSEEDTVSAPGISSQPQQTCLPQHGPENGTETPSDIPDCKPEKFVGTQRAKRENCLLPCGDMEAKQNRPNTRGKYQDSKPNTRGRSRSDSQKILGNFRWRFTWCVCAYSDRELSKRSEVSRRVKRRAKISKMSCRMKLTPLVTRKAPEIQTQSGLETARECKSSEVDHEASVSHAAKGAGGVEVQSSEKAKSAGCDPQSAAALWGQVRTGTPSVPSIPSNIFRNTQPNSNGPASSEGYLRRSVGASHCIACGECKYSSPQRTRFRNQGPKRSNLGSELPTAEFKIKKENTVGQTPDKIIVWINQYPKVTLCDIAKKCDACSHSCSYMIPDVLKTKAVHCFKQDMRARFRFLPVCFGHDKSKNKEAALGVPIEKNSCEPQSLTKHLTHLEQGLDSEMLPSQTTRGLNNSWTKNDGATCSAAFSVGKHTKKGECKTGMWSGEVGEDPKPGSDLMGVDVHRDKRIKLVENSSICSAAVKYIMEPHDQRGVPTEINRTEMSPEPFCETDEENMDDPESFTCQRVKVYTKKISLSCARASMPWPFLVRNPTRAATAVSSAGFTDPIPKDGHSIKENLSETGSSSNQTKSLLPDTPLQKQKQDGESILRGKTETGPCIMSTHPERTKMEISVHNMQSEESLGSLCSDMVSFSVTNGHQREPLMPGVDGTPTSPLLVNGLGTSSSMSTSSPSTFSLSGWETATTLSPTSDPSTKAASSSLSAMPPSPPPSSLLSYEVKESETVEKSSLYCEESQMTSCSSLSSGPPRSSDSFHSRESSPFLLQDKRKNEELLPERSPPKLEPCYSTSPSKHKGSLLCNINRERCVEIDSNEFMFPPVLSPVTSPQGHLCRTSLSNQSSSSSEEEEEETSMGANRSKTLTECQVSWIVDGGDDVSKDQLEPKISANFKTLTDSSPMKPQSSPSSDEDVGDWSEKEGPNESDREDVVDQDERGSEQVPLNPGIKGTLGPGVLTEACSSSSSDDSDEEEEEEQNSVKGVESSPTEMAERVRGRTEAGEADESQPGDLNEFTAYEQDILLVEVIQEDPELFVNLPEQSLLRLGPDRAVEAPKKKPSTAVKMSQMELERRLALAGDSHCSSPDITEETDSRPWRPRCNTNPTKVQDTCPATVRQTRRMVQSDTNNNHVNSSLESNRTQPIRTVSFPHNIPPLMGVGTGTWIKNSANVTDYRRQKSNTYCRVYFSESQSCGFKNCHFQHLPLEGDEKFCIDIVTKFSKNPASLQKAGAVFTGYYQNNPPGVYFSMPVLLCLLWALLKAGMVPDVFSVLTTSLTHNIVPCCEFLLDLFRFVRVKGLMGSVPELMQLTIKMASVGLDLSLDCLDSVKNAPVFQQAAHQSSPVAASANHQKLSTAAPFPEYINLACAIVEIELCTKQEDWKWMGEVFRSICQPSFHPNQLERISGRIAIALLSESKDKLSLPFASFAETVCQNESDDSLIKSFVGRIGVSLILRYHKTQHWAKGCKVVEIMSLLKVSYSTLKSFFGNENGASRCYLVTVAAELLLLGGRVEGALNTLRENKWFLSSSLWPCEPADLENRTRVLMLLAEKTSQRDTLEVLSNLPGIKEPNDSIDITRYSPLFSSHLKVCVDRPILSVASDMVDLMLSKKLAVEESVLQTLLNKLGKQHLWLPARKVFRHSLSEGYYSGVSAAAGLMALTVPCGLGEMELALIYEMFITVNASVIVKLPETTDASLSITLKRTQSCEREYLSAGNILMSAACIPQPKLTVHYTNVNSLQEQVFKLDVSSARRWIRHNHSWAKDIWHVKQNLSFPSPP